MTKPKRIPVAVVRRIWLDRSVSLDQAASELGITRQGLAYKARMFGLPPRGQNHELQKRGTDEEFRRLWFAGVPVRVMARLLGYASHRGVCQRREDLDLPKRTYGRGKGGGRGWRETIGATEIIAAHMAQTAAAEQRAARALWAGGRS